MQLIDKAIEYYKENENRAIDVKETQALMRISGGDARKLLNAIEIVVTQLGEDSIITNEKVSTIPG